MLRAPGEGAVARSARFRYMFLTLDAVMPAHFSAARSLMLMVKSAPGFNSSRSDEHQSRVVNHVTRVLEWASRMNIVLNSSLRSDALQVLAACGGNAAVAAGRLMQGWRMQGLKLSDKEYCAAIRAETRAFPQQQQLRERIAHLFACAAADGVAVTTSMMNAALSGQDHVHYLNELKLMRACFCSIINCAHVPHLAFVVLLHHSNP
jgi:hypothetical protein